MFPLNRHTLRFRLFLTLSLLILVITLTLSALQVFSEIRSFRQRTAEKADILAESLASTIRIPLFADYREELARSAAETARRRGVHRVMIRNASGEIVARAGNPSDPPGAVASRVTVMAKLPAAANGGPGGETTGSDSPLGTVRVTMNTEEITTFARELLLTTSLTALLFWVVASFLSYRAVAWLTRSLTPLVDGLRVIRAGDYAVRIAPAGHDELTEAADAVNELALALREREEENARLQEQLLTAMRLEVQDERQKMMARLIQTNRMTSLGLMVAGMAHEINTPNATMRLVGQQMARTWQDALPLLDRVAEEEGGFTLGGVEYRLLRDELAGSAQAIVHCSERIDRVVKNLRQYTIGERSDLSDLVDLSQVVADSLAIVRSHGVGSRVRLHSELAEGLPPVRGNRYQLEQVLTNLLVNGIQAIPEGRPGTVTVKTGVAPATGELFMRVSDDGEGIPAEVIPLLLKPFFSTRIEKGGSGLGLYISNYIVTEHGGRLDIASEPGRGTAVTMSLPPVGGGDRRVTERRQEERRNSKGEESP